VRRRDLLIAAAVAVGGAAVAGVARWLRRPADREAPEAPTPPEAPAPTDRADAEEAAPLVPPADEPWLLALAEAIVPRDGELLGARDIDLLPRLDAHVRSSASRLRVYRRGWPDLRGFLERRHASAPDAGRDEVAVVVMSFCFRMYRRPRTPPLRVRMAEQLRRDVLTVYYGSPAGWASLGYSGPPHRTPASSGPGEAKA
jgi:hypothetical protein